MDIHNAIGLSARKTAHLELSQKGQIGLSSRDPRFSYEPLFDPHPKMNSDELSLEFLGKRIAAPFWISSMTGGSSQAGSINQLLAKASAKWKIPMALGSCRSYLEDSSYRSDFELRSILGDEIPFFANLGICQVEQLISKGEESKIVKLIDDLKCDGLIVHINPLQEYFQPEGDRQKLPALDTITFCVNELELPLIVKEVGQGMGPRSLEALLQLPLLAIETAGFGGTNFSKVEFLRSSTDKDESFSLIGHSAAEMIEVANKLKLKLEADCKTKNIIISGGVRSVLDAHYLLETCKFPCVIGQAQKFLEAANEGEEQLDRYIYSLFEGLLLARRFAPLAYKESF